MKKAGMIAISLVVTAALVGGVGYGAYYTMQGKKDPIEVVPGCECELRLLGR